MVMDTSAVEEMVRRLSEHKGVEGVLISNSEGLPVRSTMDADQASECGTLVSSLSRHANVFVQSIIPDDDLQFVRLRSRQREIVIATNFDKKNNLYLTVIHNPKPREA